MATVEPRLVRHNQKGEIEGVKYDRLSAVLINASKEQQAMIESQQKQFATQNLLIEKLAQRLAALEKKQRRKGKQMIGGEVEMKLTSTLFFVVFAIVCVANSALAQTPSFTYQGKLTDGGSPANGSYDLQFALFDSSSGGTQIGSTLTRAATSVSSGVFTVQLDFGVNAFPGANRFLEIGVRPVGVGSFSILSPRQQISSTPYAVRTLSAQQADVALDANKLGGINASGYVTTSSVGNTFIKNATTPQTANFNISGNGTVGGSLTVNGASPNGLFLTNGATNFKAGISGNFVTLGTTTNSPLSLSTNGGTNNGSLTLDTSGNIGVNTIFPNHKLTIDTLGGPNWTTANWGGALALRNASAIGWQLNSSSQSFGIGQSTDGLAFFRTTSSPGTTGSPPILDMQITNQGNVGIGTPAPNAKFFVQGEAANGVGIAATGNASQSRDKGGWVKAMVYVNGDGTLLRCYNGLTGASTGNCGFTTGRVTGVPSGNYLVNFPFQINDRFYAVSVEDGGLSTTVTANFQITGTAQLEIFVKNGNTLTDRPVMVIVY
jgi:hypothetical protein